MIVLWIASYLAPRVHRWLAKLIIINMVVVVVFVPAAHAQDYCSSCVSDACRVQMCNGSEPNSRLAYGPQGRWPFYCRGGWGVRCWDDGSVMRHHNYDSPYYRGY